MSRIRCAWAMIALAGALAIGGAAPVAAVTGWTGPAAILTGRYVDDVKVGVAATGRVMVAGLDEIGVFAMPDASDRTSLVRLAPRAAVLFEGAGIAAIAGVFDRAGHSYVAWARPCDHGDCSKAGVWYTTDAGGGPNHGFATAIRLVSGRVREPAIQLRDGAIHLAYVDGQRRLHYRTNASGPWVDVQVSGPGAFYPTLILDDTGQPQIAVGMASAARFGINWAVATGTPSSPAFTLRKVPDTGEFDDRPLIGIGPGGEVWIAWTHSECSGVDPCPRPWARLIHWTGASWSSEQTAARAEALSLRFTPSGSARVLTDRPALASQAATGWTQAVLYEPVEYRKEIVAGALGLTTAGKAVVTFSDMIRTGTGRKVEKLYLMRER
jgi:hypothetical protein